MKKEKYGLETHDKRFSTEEDCEKFLGSVVWEDNRPTCPKCKNKHMNYLITARNMYKCSNCKYHFNVKSNTVFMKSKIPLRKWFKAIYLMNNSKRGIPSTQLAELLEVQQRTAYFMLQKLRATHSVDDEVLSGIVQADETLIGPDIGRNLRLRMQKIAHEEEQNRLYGYSKKRKTSIMKKLRKLPNGEELVKAFRDEQLLLHQNGERTTWRPSAMVLGIYSLSGNLILHHLGKQYIDGRTENIERQIRKHVDLSKSILITDQSEFYAKIGTEFINHKVVNHGRNYVDKKTGNNTNAIENVFTHLKKMIQGTYIKISYGHLGKYLNEQAFRWNTRKESHKSRFDTFFEGVLDCYQTQNELKITQMSAA